MWRLRLSARKVGIVVVYHGVAAESGDPSWELSPALGLRLFKAQLRHHKRRYHVVALTDLQTAVARRRRWTRLPLAITFDDDLQSHVAIAAPALRELGATATFFVAAHGASRPLAYWWETVQEAFHQGVDVTSAASATTDLATVARRVRQLGAHERDALIAELRSRVRIAVDDRGLDETDVATLAATATIGFHTCGHYELTSLQADESARELVRGLSGLRRASQQPVTAIAYPHGAADERIADAARRAGFTIGVTTRPTAVTPASDPLLLGRLEPSRLSLGHHALRLVTAIARGDSRSTTRQ
jgi:peptidoglycan/xylan/chitin deacetylase (PgdA/CDA1 family)